MLNGFTQYYCWETRRMFSASTETQITIYYIMGGGMERIVHTLLCVITGVNTRHNIHIFPAQVTSCNCCCCGVIMDGTAGWTGVMSLGIKVFILLTRRGLDMQHAGTV